MDNRTQKIPDSVPRAIRRRSENGHLPVINTGRPFGHIDPQVRAIDFAAWICSCGMEIILDGKYIYKNYPDPRICTLMRDTVRDCRMQVLYEAQDGKLLTDGANSAHEIAVIEINRLKEKGCMSQDIGSMEVPSSIKFVTFDGPGCRRDEFIHRATPYFACTERAYTMLELVPKGFSKATGMDLLLQYLHLPREDTLVIGDSTNDLPMFSAAAHTVCMGEDMEELKQEAEYVTDTVLEDGIEKALQHYHLI